MQELRAQIQAQIKLAATLRQVADQVKNSLKILCHILLIFWRISCPFWLILVNFVSILAI
jgi:hypothetical protein